MYLTDKPWGHEQILEANSSYVVKELFMRAGHQCSRQKHTQKLETIVVLSGTLQVCIYPQCLTLSAGGHVTIPPGTEHRMRAVEDCKYIECSTTELDDVVRLEDDYGRI